MRGILGAVAVLVGAMVPALAQEEASYLDNRSTAESVMASFYNAIDLHQYARAYSYYGASSETVPFSEFQAGFADTAHVEAQIGVAVPDGTAGSMYYYVPVVIEAESAGGQHKYFAGCYVLKMIQPELQEQPPYAPLYIVSGTMKPLKGKAEVALAADCVS